MSGKHISTPLLVVMAEYIAKEDNRFRSLITLSTFMSESIARFKRSDNQSRNLN